MSAKPPRAAGTAGSALATAAITVIALLVLLLPLLLRAHAGWPVMPGATGYQRLLDAEGLLRDGRISEPSGALPRAPTAYDGALALLLVLGVPWLLPAIAAALAAMLLHRSLLRRLGPSESFVAAIAFILTPAFLYAGTRYDPALLALAFLLMASLTRRHLWRSALFALGTVTAPAIGLLFGLVAFVRYARRRDANAMLSVAGGVLAAGIWVALWRGPFAVSAIGPLAASWSLLTEFGARGGLSVFFLILAAYGALRSDQQARSAFAFLFAVGIPIVFPSLLLPGSIVIATLAAGGFLAILRTPWRLDLLRHILIVIVACAAAFVLITAIRGFLSEQPSERIVDALSYVGQQRRPGGVLTDPDFAPLIRRYGGRTATLDVDAGPEEIDRAFFVRDAAQVYDLLERTNTSFILVTDSMRHEMFSRSDEGLLFLLPNTERFVPLTSDNEMTLWYYISRRTNAPVSPGASGPQ